jgi:hypothetical protein
MAEPSVDTALQRLLAHRRRDLEPGTVMSEIDAVPPGAAGTPQSLRRLAPALGLRTADLFVIAGLELPEDLAPARDTKPWDVGSVLDAAATMTPDSLDRLRNFIRALPEHVPAWPPEPGGRVDPSEPGALLVGLLSNRNIRPRHAKMLVFIGDGPYVSDSTVWMLGRGRVALTPKYVTAFAAVLGIPEADLAAMTGVEPADNPRIHPNRAELAELAWQARRLTGDQLSEAVHLAWRLWRADPRRWCSHCADYHVADQHA